MDRRFQQRLAAWLASKGKRGGHKQIGAIVTVNGLRLADAQRFGGPRLWPWQSLGSYPNEAVNAGYFLIPKAWGFEIWTV